MKIANNYITQTTKTNMITAGITPNVVLTKVSYDTNYDAVKVGFNKPTFDDFEALMSGKRMGDAGDDTDVTYYIPSRLDREGAVKSDIDLMKDFKAFRSFASHILSVYYDDSHVSEFMSGTNVFKGLDVKSLDDVKTILASEQYLLVYKNIANIMVDKLNVDKVKNTEVRVKLLRSKPDKNYVSFPYPGYEGTYEDRSGFIENMLIPAEASKLGFTMMEKGYAKSKGVDGQYIKDANGKPVWVKSDKGFDRTVPYTANVPSAIVAEVTDTAKDVVVDEDQAQAVVDLFG